MAKKKHYTYSLTCVFQVQFTFDESQVESAGEDGVDPDPTEKALADLENELRDYIGQDYAVDSVEIEDGGIGCLFLGTSEDDD